jgi:hypothetical protein
VLVECRGEGHVLSGTLFIFFSVFEKRIVSESVCL